MPHGFGFFAATGESGFVYKADPAYDLISTQSTNIAFVTSFTFGSLGTLAATYKHLEFRIMAKTGSGTSDFSDLIMRVNSSGPYSNQKFAIEASNQGGYLANDSISSFEYINIGPVSTQTSASGGNTGHYGTYIIRISDAFQAGKPKNISYQGGLYNNNNAEYRFGAAMHHTSTDGISSVEFRDAQSRRFLTASISLYGIRG